MSGWVSRCRSLAGLVLVAAGVSLATASPSEAFFGETCRDEVVVRGGWAGSYSAAVKSAKRAWEPVAAKRYGRRFADFGYSGERQFTCEWNASGSRYRCVVSARPCGAKKGR